MSRAKHGLKIPKPDSKLREPDDTVSEAEDRLLEYMAGLGPALREQLRLILHECAAPNGLRIPPDFLAAIEAVLKEKPSNV
ncbi:hypothetical protein [Bradyrhizobium cenepequi]|uniref:hypothetical protein n=1 Tax=Bradyrhizobium cenepequi TaxID=2821403 RepID=UPI001CE25F89|nr:hypothetical protein [Bradyrhizobium cenepequi]MCA6112479.1 hypothetical protein [Bradyrhizobium cenepequi]